MRNNIAEIRCSQKMTQSELAQKLNVSKNYISSIENDKDINQITLYKIARAIHTTEKRIYDFSDRKRTKPDFNPHMEAFWVQGCQARGYIDKQYQVSIVDRLLCRLDEDEIGKTLSPISDLKNLQLYDIYCLYPFVDDIKTSDKASDVSLMFASGVIGIDFSICVALMDKRSDIIQSFINGLTNANETRGGKDGYNNIKIIREQAGLTQIALAQKCEITLAILRQIESKKYCSDVHLKKAKEIAEALDCEFTDLFSKTPKDIYNVQAKKAGAAFRNTYNTTALQKALLRDKDQIDLCVRDIIAFLNIMKSKKIKQSEKLQFTLL